MTYAVLNPLSPMIIGVPSVLAHSLSQFRPDLFEGRTLLVWCGENQTSAQQQQQLNAWRAEGHDIYPLGI